MLDEELVLVDVEATLCHGLAYVPGRLKVTGKRFLFDPDPSATRVATVEFNIEDIKKAEAIPAMRWLPNGFGVTTYSGQSVKVLVHRNDAIAKVIGLIQSEEGVYPL